MQSLKLPLLLKVGVRRFGMFLLFKFEDFEFHSGRNSHFEDVKFFALQIVNFEVFHSYVRSDLRFQASFQGLNALGVSQSNRTIFSFILKLMNELGSAEFRHRVHCTVIEGLRQSCQSYSLLCNSAAWLASELGLLQQRFCSD